MQLYSTSLWLTIIILTVLPDLARSCSCMQSHPQEHFCNSDFVILARVRRQRILNNTMIYKVHVRKYYKMSEKAYTALKSGRLITSAFDAMCGVVLEKGKLYVISGHVNALRAHINLCNYHERWENISRIQRKGFRKMYRYGCNCQIKKCWRSIKCGRSKGVCDWSSRCHDKMGICLRQSKGNCKWTRNMDLLRCLHEENEDKLNKLTISRWSG